ncbi:metallophosphoesterase [Halobacterium zhouii]|uniref:metallophosphoesterase n=1 Tax=Halobacterium zhouii TaxID=2902624 RepID=UPI001E2D2395|nr:metallophosphoesterase [Halobacterium zhouii]
MTDPPSWATFAERAVYLSDADALVLADFHVGRDAASNVALPLGERADLTERLHALLGEFAPSVVVFAGDVLHVHGSLPDGAEATVRALVDAVAEAGASLRVARGNHDTMLDSFGVDVDAAVELADGTVVCHGHEEPTADAERLVVGHEHPAIRVEGQRHPCFLYGPGEYESADALVLPAFSRLAAGTLVNGLTPGSSLSPLLRDPDDFHPVVVSDDDPLVFPRLGDLRSHL